MEPSAAEMARVFLRDQLIWDWGIKNDLWGSNSIFCWV
jgi:hypothetical protein